MLSTILQSTLSIIPLENIVLSSIWAEYSSLGTFFLIALISTFLSLALFALSFFGVGEVDASDGVGADIGIFSLRAITGFFLGLGWGGFIAAQYSDNPVVHLVCGLLVGSLMFLSVALLIKMVKHLHSDGTIHSESLLGLHGTVYLSIPPNGETGGQVQISHPNQLVTIAATQKGGEVLSAQTHIRVIESHSASVVVEKL